MTAPRRLIIDCDPGLDDAIAIALAAASPEIAIDLLTTVEGNAPLAMVTANACAIAAALDLTVEVHAGAAAPPADPPRLSTVLWGGDGALGLPPGDPPAGRDAVTAMARWLDSQPPPGEGEGPTIVGIGPLTNIAALLKSRPDLAARIGSLVLMGGALGRGNATPMAELNIWIDPPAAAAVLRSPIAAAIVPLDITRKVIAGADLAAALAGSARPPARLVAGLLPKAGIDSHPSAIHDACAIGLLLWPELFQLEGGRLDVVTAPGEREGQTVFSPDPGGPHRVAVDLDVAPFMRRMAARLAGREV